MTGVTNISPECNSDAVQWEIVKIQGLEHAPELGFMAFQQKVTAVQNLYVSLMKRPILDPQDVAKFTKRCSELVQQADSFKELLEETHSFSSYYLRVQTMFFECQEQLKHAKNNYAVTLSATYRSICWKFI